YAQALGADLEEGIFRGRRGMGRRRTSARPAGYADSEKRIITSDARNIAIIPAAINLASISSAFVDPASIELAAGMRVLCSVRGFACHQRVAVGHEFRARQAGPASLG